MLGKGQRTILQLMPFRVPGIELKTPQAWKCEKKIRKRHEIPHPDSGPENTEKKYREKIQKWPENGRFRLFLYFFRIFGARPGVGDFVTFL